MVLFFSKCNDSVTRIFFIKIGYRNAVTLILNSFKIPQKNQNKQQLFVIVFAWRLQIIEKMQYNAGHENGILIQTRSIIIAAENLSSELHDYF